MVKENKNKNIDSELRRVGKNTAIYSIGNIGVKVVSFLLIPVYTHFLSVYEVGIIVLLELLEVLYGYVAPLGVLSGIFRFFFNAKKEGKGKRFLASNYLFMLGANSLILVFFILTGEFSARFFLSDGSLTRLIQVFYITLFFSLTRVFLLNLFRIYEKPILFIITAFVYFLMIMSLSIWFIVGLELGLWGVVWAKLITSGLIFIFAFVFLIKKLGFHYHHADVKKSLSYGMPMVIHGVSLLVLSMGDRYIVKEIISVEASGIYGIAFKFGMIMNMILVTPFIQAWQPMLFRLENKPEQKLTYQKTALHYVQIGMILWLVISIGAKYLIKWSTTEPYHVGIILVPFIAFSYLLYGLQDIFKAGALLNNLTIRVTILGISAAVVNIILNLFVISEYELLGASVVKVISYAALMFFILRLSQKHFYINWLWKKMILITILGLLIYSLSLKEFNNDLLTFLKDFLAVSIFPILMILFRLISISEILRFMKGFKSRIS